MYPEQAPEGLIHSAADSIHGQKWWVEDNMTDGPSYTDPQASSLQVDDTSSPRSFPQKAFELSPPVDENDADAWST